MLWPTQIIECDYIIRSDQVKQFCHVCSSCIENQIEISETVDQCELQTNSLEEKLDMSQWSITRTQKQCNIDEIGAMTGTCAANIATEIKNVWERQGAFRCHPEPPQLILGWLQECALLPSYCIVHITSCVIDSTITFSCFFSLPYQALGCRQIMKSFISYEY